jgi:hypothetical protein
MIRLTFEGEAFDIERDVVHLAGLIKSGRFLQDAQAKAQTLQQHALQEELKPELPVADAQVIEEEPVEPPKKRGRPPKSTPSSSQQESGAAPQESNAESPKDTEQAATQPEEVPDVPKDLEELRALVMQVAGKTSVKTCEAIIAKYGKKISEIEVDKYPAMTKDLRLAMGML